jgi:hypothetical protein
MSHSTPGDTSYHWTYLGLATGVIILAAAFEVNGHGRVVVPIVGISLPDTCFFKCLTGYGCPGCGLTRCFISLAHGEPERAWDFNPGGFVLFAVVAAQIPYRMIQIWRIRHKLHEWRPVTLSTVIGCLLAGLLLVQWIWRSLP